MATKLLQLAANVLGALAGLVVVVGLVAYILGVR